MLLSILPATPVWQIALFGGNLLAFVVLLIRIVSMRLVRSYPALVLWLGANIVLSLAPWIVRMNNQVYYWFYMWAQGSTDILYVLAMLELYGKVLRNLRGFASVARRAIPVIVAVSAIASASLLAFEGTPVRYIDYFYRVDRTVITSMALLVLTITAFLVWFPIRVSRNTLIYSIGYAAYLVPTGTGMFLMNSGHAASGIINAAEGTIGGLCLLFWAVALNRAGETSIVAPGRQFHPNDEARLLAQLEAANRFILRATEKEPLGRGR